MKYKTSTGTITRTVLLAVALLNQILIVFGLTPLPIEDETITMLIASAATVITSLLAWWKNNSFTDAAKRGDAVLHDLKKKGA